MYFIVVHIFFITTTRQENYGKDGNCIVERRWKKMSIEKKWKRRREECPSTAGKLSTRKNAEEVMVRKTLI